MRPLLTLLLLLILVASSAASAQLPLGPREPGLVLRYALSDGGQIVDSVMGTQAGVTRIQRRTFARDGRLETVEQREFTRSSGGSFLKTANGDQLFYPPVWPTTEEWAAGYAGRQYRYVPGPPDTAWIDGEAIPVHRVHLTITTAGGARGSPAVIEFLFSESLGFIRRSLLPAGAPSDYRLIAITRPRPVQVVERLVRDTIRVVSQSGRPVQSHSGWTIPVYLGSSFWMHFPTGEIQQNCSSCSMWGADAELGSRTAPLGVRVLVGVGRAGNEGNSGGVLLNGADVTWTMKSRMERIDGFVAVGLRSVDDRVRIPSSTGHYGWSIGLGLVRNLARGAFVLEAIGIPDAMVFRPPGSRSVRGDGLGFRIGYRHF